MLSSVFSDIMSAITAMVTTVIDIVGEVTDGE